MLFYYRWKILHRILCGSSQDLQSIQMKNPPIAAAAAAAAQHSMEQQRAFSAPQRALRSVR
jgi:hypothetical protein